MILIHVTRYLENTKFGRSKTGKKLNVNAFVEELFNGVVDARGAAANAT